MVWAGRWRIPHRDPYTISEDGHIVGHDGFIVPKNYVEFNERYPCYIRGFVRRRWFRASAFECEDRQQDLVLHLLSLPDGSKFRRPGYNGLEHGCVDRIQIFHPNQTFGASAARFFSYINLCLLNHSCSLSRKVFSNPVLRHTTLSLYSPNDLGEMVDDDYIYATAMQSYTGCSYHHTLEDGILFNQFLSFVEIHNVELISVIEAISDTETLVEAQKRLGLTKKLFLRARNRLSVLHTCFTSSIQPPRQRKVYNARHKQIVLASLVLMSEFPHLHRLPISFACSDISVVAPIEAAVKIAGTLDRNSVKLNGPFRQRKSA